MYIIMIYHLNQMYIQSISTKQKTYIRVCTHYQNIPNMYMLVFYIPFSKSSAKGKCKYTSANMIMRVYTYVHA